MGVTTQAHATTAPAPVEPPSSAPGTLPGIRRLRIHPVVLIAVLAAALRVPYLRAPMSPDEGGFLVVARHWHPGGGSLYGPYWVDRPPLLIAFFRLADALGGFTALRLLGCLLVASAVIGVAVAAASTARSATESRRASVWAAAVAARTAGHTDGRRRHGQRRADRCPVHRLRRRVRHPRGARRRRTHVRPAAAARHRCGGRGRLRGRRTDGQAEHARRPRLRRRPRCGGRRSPEGRDRGADPSGTPGAGRCRRRPGRDPGWRPGPRHAHRGASSTRCIRSACAPPRRCSTSPPPSGRHT